MKKIIVLTILAIAILTGCAEKNDAGMIADVEPSEPIEEIETHPQIYTVEYTVWKDEFKVLKINDNSLALAKSTVGDSEEAGISLGFDTSSEMASPNERPVINIINSDIHESFSISISNTSDKEIPIKDCTIYGFTYTQHGTPVIDLEFAGVKCGDTFEKAIEILGPPYSIYHDVGFQNYQWLSEEGNQILLSGKDTISEISVMVY